MPDATKEKRLFDIIRSSVADLLIEIRLIDCILENKWKQGKGSN